MNTIVIEHVSLNELPAAWRAQLPVTSTARVTVRIEEETAEQTETSPLAGNPLFGMWQDRADMDDVPAYLQKLRAPRYAPDGSRRED